MNVSCLWQVTPHMLHRIQEFNRSIRNHIKYLKSLVNIKSIFQSNKDFEMTFKINKHCPYLDLHFDLHLHLDKTLTEYRIKETKFFTSLSKSVTPCLIETNTNYLHSESFVSILGLRLGVLYVNKCCWETNLEDKLTFCH